MSRFPIILICFNSRPSCEGRRSLCWQGFAHQVSIHAPRVRGDSLVVPRRLCSSFNSRPSCEGRRPLDGVRRGVLGFNSRPSCEGRHSQPVEKLESQVSIHAPRVRGDATSSCASCAMRFNSRPSCEGRHLRAPRSRRAAFQFTPLV